MRWPGSLAQWRSGEFTRVQQTGVVQCSGLRLYTVLFDPLALVVPAQAGAAVQCQAEYASPLVGLVNGELRCSEPLHWRTAVLTAAADGPPLTKKEKKQTHLEVYLLLLLLSTILYYYTYLLPIYLLLCSSILQYYTVLFFILQYCTLLAVDSTLQLVGRALPTLKYIHSMYVYLFALCCCTYM